MEATDPAENPTTPCAAPAPAGVVAHTFIYVRGNTSETTLQLYDNKLVSYGSNEPHGSWSYAWHADGMDGWQGAYGKGVFTITFNGNPDHPDRLPREHVFTQLDDTNAYRLKDKDARWSVVIIEKK